VILLFVLALGSADCAGCHATEAAAFASSRHARAARLDAFELSERHAGTRWCAGCHRPEGARTAGLECLSCHRGTGGAILATHRGTDDARAAHPIVVEPALAITSCARCHQFATPLPDHLDPVVYSSQPLQSTVTELRRHDPTARCSACHAVHRPAGGHDAASVRAAVQIAARTTAGGVELRVTARRTGHRFPTGDPFRRLVITTCADPACARPIARRTIGKTFALVGGVWAPVVDRSLADGETRVFRFAPARAWRADFYLGDTRFEARLPASEVAIEIARGSF